MSRRWALPALIATSVLIAAGCGSGEENSSGVDAGGSESQSAAEVPKEKGVPKALAANRAQGNELLDEGSLDGKLSELKGFPIVVNQWASWCPPCRNEFPIFQESSEAHAKDVAFLGIDMQDDRDAAEQFLAELPIPYPSIFDPDASAIGSLGGGVVSPTTVFIDRKGEIVNVFQGEYLSLNQLEKDIEKHLLGSSS